MTTDYTSSVAVSGNYAYINDVNNGLVGRGYHCPHSPTLKGSYLYWLLCRLHIAVSSEYAYITSACQTCDRGISVIPATPPRFAGSV